MLAAARPSSTSCAVAACGDAVASSDDAVSKTRGETVLDIDFPLNGGSIVLDPCFFAILGGGRRS
ncbi:hypothetical protein FHS96_003773 [Sphingomonas zeicaulis]|uniref:hypothetical protein n=1 Tax=Sphingomonas zeicaulis TaxID=1632740 RepID=UPI003D20B01E